MLNAKSTGHLQPDAARGLLFDPFPLWLTSHRLSADLTSSRIFPTPKLLHRCLSLSLTLPPQHLNCIPQMDSRFWRTNPVDAVS